MTDRKRTSKQTERREMYQGSNKVDSSHYISAKERLYFNLPNKNDTLSNYRNQNPTTNRSNHNKIDNFLLKNNKKHSYEGQTLQGKNGSIYACESRNRIQHKIDVAKENGDIHNDRFRNYLKKAANAYDMDLRQFNGYWTPIPKIILPFFVPCYRIKKNKKKNFLSEYFVIKDEEWEF